MTLLQCTLYISFLFLGTVLSQRQNLPDLASTPSKPIRAVVGDDINIDCVVSNRNNLTLLWKYVNGTSETLLAANEVVVSDDKRLSIIHQKGRF